MSNTSKQNSSATSSLPTSVEIKDGEFIDPNTFNMPNSILGFALSKSPVSDLGENALYVSNEPISFKGQEWQAVNPSISEKTYYSYKSTFKNFLERELYKKGYVKNLTQNGKMYQTVVADGPTGSQWGYLKISNGKIQVIVVSAEKSLINNSFEVKIFLSNVEDLNKILK